MTSDLIYIGGRGVRPRPSHQVVCNVMVANGTNQNKIKTAYNMGKWSDLREETDWTI